MWGARRMAPLFEQCANASGATARTSSTAATKQSCCCSVNAEVGRVGVGEVREHAGDLDVGRVLGERAEELGQPSGLTPSRPIPVSTFTCTRARRPTSAAAPAVVSTPSSSYTVVSMPCVDQCFVAPRIAPPDDQHGHPERRHVEGLGRRRHAEPRRPAVDRRLGREPQPVPVAVRLHHRHHLHAAAHVLAPAPTCWRGSPTRRPRPACAA